MLIPFVYIYQQPTTYKWIFFMLLIIITKKDKP